MNLERSSEQEVHHHYHGGWCCAPIGRSGGLFCGLALMLVGGLWLFDNLGWMPAAWWDFIAPALLIAWGISILSGSRERSVST